MERCQEAAEECAQGLTNTAFVKASAGDWRHRPQLSLDALLCTECCFRRLPDCCGPAHMLPACSLLAEPLQVPPTCLPQSLSQSMVSGGFWCNAPRGMTQ